MYLDLRGVLEKDYFCINSLFFNCDAGTLQGFAFDSDEEFERPAVEKGASPEKIKHEEGADDGKETKKKKLPAKTPVHSRNRLI